MQQISPTQILQQDLTDLCITRGWVNQEVYSRTRMVLLSVDPFNFGILNCKSPQQLRKDLGGGGPLGFDLGPDVA